MRTVYIYILLLVGGVFEVMGQGVAAEPDSLLTQGEEIDVVRVRGRRNGGNFIQSSGINKIEVISYAGLCKMACCNLAESFENSAAVTVGFSDAISGARQIQMLGLAGIYTQMLDESRAVMRGLGSPYGLSYTPGMWLNSIQVSKGISSVTGGHDALTGQINLEHRKPTDSERLFLNLFLNSELRPEVNISTALPVNRSGTLSTVVLVHASGDTGVVDMDHNNDGFRDMAHSQFYTVANRWSYLASDGMQLRWGFKLLQDRRTGGSMGYKDSQRESMFEDNVYGSVISNRGGNAYLKFGMPVGKSGIIDPDTEDLLRSNVAVVVDFDHFHQNAYFGLNNYHGEQNAFSVNAMYNHYFSHKSSLITGLTTQLNTYTELLDNKTPWLEDTQRQYNLSRTENELGAYTEYTFQHNDQFSLIAGLRGDYNQFYNRFYLTPRGQLRWGITPTTTLRSSIGMGFRTANIITDNIGILATGRQIIIANNTAIDQLEKALTYGTSLTQQFSLLEGNDATISLDYFRTEFQNQVIVDQEMNPESIYIYNSTLPSYTNSYQMDFMWKPNEHFDIFATFRYTDSQITLNREDGTTYKTERPLVSRYKTLLNLQYATHLRRWVFDITAQLNGPCRLPVIDDGAENIEYSPAYPMFFAQVSRRISSWEVYLGCENIANYRQENPIIAADNPYSTEFNSSVVWGPLMGRKFYIGARFNMY